MAPLYYSENSITREIKDAPTTIGGVVRQQKEMWAGIAGVKRRIFNHVVLATWQKWNLKTIYYFKRKTSTNSKDIYTGGNTTYKYFSPVLPSVTSQRFDVLPTSFSQIFPTMTSISSSSIRVSSPVPNSGYYAAFITVRLLILCRVFYMEQGEYLTQDPKDFRTYVFPSPRDQYYAEQITNYQKGTTLIGTVTAPEGTYPNNGRSGDYWYVKI